MVVGQRQPLVSGMIDLKSFQSVENIPLDFVHIKQLLTESGQHKHVLFCLWICSSFVGIFGFYGRLGVIEFMA